MELSNGQNVIEYPRGFKGLHLGHKARINHKHRDYELLAIGGIGFPNPTVTKQDIFNEDIENAYNAMLNNKPGVLGMEFREKVFLLALQTFANGHLSLSDFINWQIKDGKISKFIDDTFKYVLTGQRELAIQTWQAMLNLDNLVMIDMNDAVNVKTMMSGSQSAIDLIQKWCSHQNGFMDMLFTLRILYGDE